MSKLITCLKTMPLICVALAPAFGVQAQTPAVNQVGVYTFAPLSSPGSTATSLYLADANGAPANFTIDAVTTGTAPTTCTFEVQGSPDGVNWDSGTGSLSGPLDCHSAGVLTTSFFGKPVVYLRVKLTALTGGDGTTRVTFTYVRARS